MAIYPIVVTLTDNCNQKILETILDPKHLYFITNDLLIIENYLFTSWFFEFSGQGYYTNQSNRLDLIDLSLNCTAQQKLQATQVAISRDLSYLELKERYQHLLEDRRKISDLSIQNRELRSQVSGLLQTKKSHFPLLRLKQNLQDELFQLNSGSNESLSLEKQSRSLIAENSGQLQVAIKLLNAHNRKYKERTDSVQKE